MTIIVYQSISVCCLFQTDSGETALVAAIGKGNIQIVDVLVKNGANINYQTKVRKSRISCTDHHFSKFI